MVRALMVSAVEFEYTGIGTAPKNVTRVVIHSSVTEIGRGAFYNCRQLKEVVLNEGLRKIGDESFAECVLLDRIKFPSTVTEVGEGSFRDCRQLQEVVLNEGLQKIGERSFEKCVLLQSIKVPSAVSKIGNDAFYSCRNLRELTLNEGLQKIGDRAFEYCSLEIITFPSSLSVVGGWAFSNCDKLKEVVLNKGLQKIRHRAFQYCPSLEIIKCPSTISEIGDGAFSNCRNLREVELNKRIKTIGQRAFLRCESLDSIKFSCISRRLGAISRVGQTIIQNEINQIPGLEMRGGEILISAVAMRNGGGWESEAQRENLDRILGLITYHELEEATTIFELALWKANMGEEMASGFDNRNASRIAVPGPVKDAVLQFCSCDRGL